MRALALLLVALLLGSCANGPPRTELVIQRFFGECDAQYGRSTDTAAPDSECGILTTTINAFKAANPDIDLVVNIVPWPGYVQLNAQVAARDPPDLVTMHQSVIADYQSRGLLAPMDAVLARAGLPRATFTPAALRGVVKDGRMYAMPLDTVGGLWHINTRLMAQAGLMRDGRPVLPHSAAELLKQARQFKARTGKPYLVQAQVAAADFHVRNLYTYLLAQGVPMFPDAAHIRLDGPQAHAIVALFRQLNEERLSTVNQDFPAATASFINGEGGIFPVGTWMIGPYDKEAATPGRPLYRSYAVLPPAPLWGRPAAFVDGHSWVMPARERSPARMAAAARFLRFIADHDRDWARTGHLPAVAAVLADPKFQALPHRRDIAVLATIGVQLPPFVRRQTVVQGLIGEQLEVAVTGAKPIGDALREAEQRIDAMFAEIL